MVAVDNLPVFGWGLGASATELVVNTHYQLPQTYTLRLGSLRSQSGLALTGSSTVQFRGVGGVPATTVDAQTASSLSSLRAAGWHAVDDPRADKAKPSRWSAAAGVIEQRSNIYGGVSGSHAYPERYGTYLLWQGQMLTDAWIEAVCESGDDDGWGLMVRYRDVNNYCRFEWDRQRRRRRLVEVVGGTSRELAFDTQAYDEDRGYRVRLAAHGSALAVMIDGKTTLSAQVSSSGGAGECGLFCWGNNKLSVRDVAIASISQPLAAPAGVQAQQRPDAPTTDLGVSASEVTHEEVLLWTRASREASVRFEVATDPSFAGAVTTPTVSATSATDYMVAAAVASLQPRTRYYYRALVSHTSTPAVINVSRVGRFVTAPDQTMAADVRFALSADFHWGVDSRFDLLDKIADRAPEFFLNLGDFPYTDSTPAATTLSRYRDKHKRIRALPAMRAFLSRVSTFSVWDDHEIENDWDARTSSSRVALGTRVWKEFFPIRPAAPAGGGIYRSFRWGKALEVFLLDTRYFRDSNGAPNNANKTMLGSAQRQWLLDGLSRSTATNKIVVSSVPLRFGTTGSDHWAGFRHERGLLFDHIRDNNIAGVFFLSGDQHWAAVHHHAEGFVEVQACPLTAFLREPPRTRDPHVVFLRKTHCYGMVHIDGQGGGASVDLFDGNDQLMHTEVIR